MPGKSSVRSRRDDGRYDFDRLERPCECGHTLGHHLAHGDHPCMVGQNYPGDLCNCVKFRPVRRKAVKRHGVTTFKDAATPGRCESRSHERTETVQQFGRSYCSITCRFCGAEVRGLTSGRWPAAASGVPVARSTTPGARRTRGRRRRMDPETRDKLREAARRRGNCPKCGGGEVRDATAGEVGGMPGISYRQCPACGHSWAVVKRRRPEL